MRKNDIVDRYTVKSALIRERDERLDLKKQREVRLEEDLKQAKEGIEQYNLENPEEEQQVFNEEEFLEKWNADPDNKEIEEGEEVILDIDEDFIIQDL